MERLKNMFNVKWQLVIYDLIAFLATDFVLIKIYKNFLALGLNDIIAN